MKFALCLCVCLMLLFSAKETKAQYQLPRQSKFIVLQSDTLQLDSFLVVKGSLLVNGYKEHLDFEFNYYSSTFTNKKIPLGSSLYVSYQPINTGLLKVYQKKDVKLLLPNIKANSNPFQYVPSDKQFDLGLEKDGVLVNGSIMRGLSLGNNQNAIVNANLNLQLSGRINNEVDILAAISDDNNPIQPEGNTQDIQDFDQVFVQLSKGSNRVVVGDYLLNRPKDSYFLNYQKKLRGIQVGSTQTFKNKQTLTVEAEAALSRGRFVRNTIPGVEGNQGPYRLSGPNGELFIIIVSGTEVVYLDGERLTRGEQNDYIIDYNTGEITFMPKRLITGYARIVVEFQYADRYYARTALGTHVQWQGAKFKTYFNYFTETDNKNQPFQQLLSDSNKLILANVGDQLSQAFTESAVAVFPFDPKRILYRKIDSLGFNTIYVHAPAATDDSIYYELRFTYVGSNKGNYKQAASASNGRVFNWVSPVNGIAQGDFEPVTYLVAPNRKQLLSAGTILQMHKNHMVKVELAMSDNNKNLFSEKDKGDNLGYGLKVESFHKYYLADTNFRFESQLFYEVVTKTFRNIERYRSVEFDRTWNRQLQNTTNQDTGNQEHIVNWRIAFVNKNKWLLQYQLGYYNRGVATYLGYRQQAGLRYKDELNSFDLSAEIVQGKQRPFAFLDGFGNKVKVMQGQYTRNLFGQLLSARILLDESRFLTAKDSLLSGSYAYTEYGFALQPKDSTKYSYYLEYKNRVDQLPTENGFKQHTVANDYKAGVSLVQKNFNRLSTDIALRDFKVLDTAFAGLKPELTFLSRITYDYGFFKRKVTANSYLQLGSGNELRRDFQYFQVPVGQGLYVWKDFNEDGIQQLNEFQLASFADKNLADYIKVFLPTTSLISTYTTQISQTLNINFGSPSSQQRNLKNFIKRFSNQSGVRYEKKTGAAESLKLSRFTRFNPNDTNLITLNSVLRNTLFFNRSAAIWGMDLNWSNQSSKSLLTNGYELRSKEEYGLNFRFNINQSWTFNNGLNQGFKRLNSDFFSENNFQYRFLETKPKLTYQLNQTWRFSINYMHSQANNLPELGGEQALVNQVGTEWRFSKPKLGVLTINYNFYEVNYDGSLNSPLAYDMLQGLSIGNNQIWTLNLQQRIGQNLQINFNYEGRKSGEIPIIHVGKMEARYLF